MEKHVRIHRNASSGSQYSSFEASGAPMEPLLSLASVEAYHLLPSVAESNMFPSVQASICFPSVMEDGRMACKIGELRGSVWEPLEGVLARQSSWYEVEVSGSK